MPFNRNIVQIEPDWFEAFGQPPQFEVRIVREGPRNLFVLGLSHSQVQVGTRFRRILVANADETPQHIADVDLRVISIAAFFNRLNRVNANTTASLLLIGDWGNLITEMIAGDWHEADGLWHQWAPIADANLRLLLAR